MTPLPLPAHAERPLRPLDERIALAEQRLLAREQRLQQGVQTLLQRTQAALAPQRLVMPAAWALGGLALAWITLRLLRRRRDAGAADVHAASVPTPNATRSLLGVFDGVRWERALPLLWPLLPVAWRGRMGPSTRSILVTVALPLAAGLFRRTLRRR